MHESTCGGTKAYRDVVARHAGLGLLDALVKAEAAQYKAVVKQAKGFPNGVGGVSKARRVERTPPSGLQTQTQEGVAK